VTERNEPVPARGDQQLLARQLVKQARAEGVERVGPGGLLDVGQGEGGGSGRVYLSPSDFAPTFMSATTGEASAPPRIRASAWARHVQVQITSIDGRRVAAIAAPLPRQHTETQTALNQTIIDHLNGARAAINYQRPSVARLADWWRGTSVEQAFASLHAARVFLVDLLPDDEVQTLVPDAVARVGSCLFPTDPRRLAVEHLPYEHHSARRRSALRHALEMAYAASDESHARLRALRNVLLLAALLIAAFMACFIWFISVDPAAVPMCFHPTVSAADAEQAARTFGGGAADYPDRAVCPTGEQVLGGPKQLPSYRDVQIVAGLGVLGGALATTVSLRKLSGKITPYGIPVAVALLKLPIGALTAVAGILLLGGAFVPGLSNLDSQRQILAYALVLGFAQQLVTQFIDRRASALIAQVPTKHPDTAPTKSLPHLTSPTSPPAPTAAMDRTNGDRSLSA
jgi:hypothetical protein